MGMSKAKAEQVSHHGCHAVGTQPDSHAQRLFVALVEHGSNHYRVSENVPFHIPRLGWVHTLHGLTPAFAIPMRNLRTRVPTSFFAPI